MSARFVTWFECGFFSMQQGMMFFFIGITMAIVQGIIKLFYGAMRTLQMEIRQNIPVIFALYSYCSFTSCKNLSLLHTETLKGDLQAIQQGHLLPFVCNRNCFLENKPQLCQCFSK